MRFHFPMSSERWQYRDPNGGLTVSIASPVLHLFDGSRQRLWQRERGGALFAKSIGADGWLEVVEASSPHPDDRAGWNWLELSHQRCLDEIRERFARGLHFIGYWHTHPERLPKPSARDIASFHRNLQGGGIALRKLVAVIVGTDRTAAGLCVALISDREPTLSILLPMCDSKRQVRCPDHS